MEKNSNLWKIVFVASFIGLTVDGMDIQMLSLVMPSLIDEFVLDTKAAGWISTFSLLGMALGGILGGWLSDRFGRVKMMTYMMILFSVGTALLAFVQTYEQFIIVRFISAIGMGAEYSLATMLMAEYVKVKNRATIMGVLGSSYSLGYLIAVLLAGVILPEYGWRPLFLISIFPVVVAIYIRVKVPEPTGWRLAKKQAKTSKVKKSNEWLALFRDKKVFTIFLLWIVTSSLLQFGYYGVGTWLPTYIVKELGFNFKEMTGYLIGTYTASILGKALAGWVANVIGRRGVFVIAGLSTAVMLPVIYFYQSPGNIIILMTVLGFVYGAPYGVNATYLSESFPTHIRGTAVGAAYNTGRIGAALAPILIGIIATTQSIGFGLAVLGISYAFMGLIPALFIKEKMYDTFENDTKGEMLEKEGELGKEGVLAEEVLVQKS
ncbi:MFS transporter [Lysinibacillus xylanilyticus]|uniref:MFS transporter n=1 Tax=Lysinibacillus xylanilyticus TaxID=582475 RepID=UPI003CFEA2B2